MPVSKKSATCELSYILHCKTLKKRHRAIQNKWHGMLISGVVLFHDNSRPHRAAHTQALMEQLNWELFHHPPYSPDVFLSECHLFTYLKNWLGSQCFSNNEELTDDFKMRLTSQAADFFDTRKQKCIPLYDKCLNYGGDYVEK
jgi:transposase